MILRFLITTISILSVINSYSQHKKMLIYDLEKNTLDSVQIPAFDTSISMDKTEGNIGTFNSNIANLERTLPTTFKYPQADYSLKIRVSKNHNIEDFPFRTSGRLFKANKDTSIGQCSGNMVGPYHYLTAAHCLKGAHNILDDKWADTLLSDSFFIRPAFDNGLANSNFGDIPVTKIYLLKKYTLNGEDLALCELKEPIGLKTGWIGYGFSDEDTSITNHMNYKFAYPGFQFALDTFNFNGDTLYYYYGKVNILNEQFIAVQSGRAIPGESGSSIIVSQNKLDYTSYGCLSYSFQQTNSRINNYEFYAFKNIIDAKPVHTNELSHPEISLYPNPSNGAFLITGLTNDIQIAICNALGQNVFYKQQGNQFHLENAAPGIYYIDGELNKRRFTKKLIIAE